MLCCRKARRTTQCGAKKTAKIQCVLSVVSINFKSRVLLNKNKIQLYYLFKTTIMLIWDFLLLKIYIKINIIYGYLCNYFNFRLQN